MARRAALLIIVLAAVFALLAGLPALVDLAADWYWFRALGFQSVFLTALWTKAWLGVLVGLVSAMQAMLADEWAAPEL